MSERERERERGGEGGCRFPISLAFGVVTSQQEKVYLGGKGKGKGGRGGGGARRRSGSAKAVVRVCKQREV